MSQFKPNQDSLRSKEATHADHIEMVRKERSACRVGDVNGGSSTRSLESEDRRKSCEASSDRKRPPPLMVRREYIQMKMKHPITT